MSPDSSLIAIACLDPIIQLWSLERGEHFSCLNGRSIDIAEEDEVGVYTIEFSHDGCLLACAGRMTFGIYIYCVETGKQKTTLDANGVETYSIMFTLDNRTLFGIDFDDAHVTQWCLETGKPIRELKSSFGLG
jgi:WD40 repeat protein